MKSIEAIRNALAYAKFEDSDIKEAVGDALKCLENELESEDYEEGPDVEEATKSLNEAIDETDSEKEVDNNEDDEDNEFSGLGDGDGDEES